MHRDTGWYTTRRRRRYYTQTADGAMVGASEQVILFLFCWIVVGSYGTDRRGRMWDVGGRRGE